MHSLCLCVIKMLYCVYAPNGVADEVDFDDLVRALKSASDVLSATGKYWFEIKRSQYMLNRIPMAMMRLLMQGVNQDRPLFGLPFADEVPSAGSLKRPDDMIYIYMDLKLLSLAFDSSDTGITPAPFPLYGVPSSAFVSTDLLSYFTDTWADVNVNDAELSGEQYSDAYKVTQDFFVLGIGHGDLSMVDEPCFMRPHQSSVLYEAIQSNKRVILFFHSGRSPQEPEFSRFSACKLQIHMSGFGPVTCW